MTKPPPSSVSPEPRERHCSGFSLVEVVIAIGISAFCLIAILGLLPTGLRAVKNSNEEAAAANVMNSIVDSLRSASTGTNLYSAVYSFTYAGQPNSYAIGGGSTNCSWTNLTLEGITNSAWKRLSAVLIINPPATYATLGTSTISVAWSASANPVWITTTKTWSNAQGSLTTAVQFLPKVFPRQ